jgi:hypothetical protein
MEVPSRRISLRRDNHMKKALSIIGALLLTAAAVAPTADASVAVSIAVGDRPYYVHGPAYYAGPVHYVWVPGHHVWRHHHRVWVHGFYVAR